MGLQGNCTALHGMIARDCTELHGNCIGFHGNCMGSHRIAWEVHRVTWDCTRSAWGCTGLRGNCMGLRGIARNSMGWHGIAWDNCMGLHSVAQNRMGLHGIPWDYMDISQDSVGLHGKQRLTARTEPLLRAYKGFGGRGGHFAPLGWAQPPVAALGQIFGALGQSGHIYSPGGGTSNPGDTGAALGTFRSFEIGV